MKHHSLQPSTGILRRFPRTLAVLWRQFPCVLITLGLLVLTSSATHASTAYGTINNFDTVNDTGTNCHGFEIELEDIHSTDVTYTYDWNHYGTPRITEDNSNPLHPRVLVRYASKKNADGSWASYTAVPSGPIAPTDGHRFTDPSVNFGGEHFGMGYRGRPTNVTYHWLVDDGSGGLIRCGSVQVATPTFTYYPPFVGVPAQVQAVIQPPPAPPVREFGPASWVKEIRTETHNNRKVKLRDLVSDDPDDDDDKNWRNDEPDEVEVEWEILQTEFFADPEDHGGKKGKLEGQPEDLDEGDEIITRRYEFYAYVGPIDPESGEAEADEVGPDGIHGVDEYADVVIVGDYLGAQMSAFDNELPIGLVEHLPEGVIDEEYATRTVIIAGIPFTATLTGELPIGLVMDLETGELFGTPVESGIFTFTLRVSATNNPVQVKTYTVAIADVGEELPPHSTVDTSAAVADTGTTTGSGFYTNGTIATVTATPAAGFGFVKWTDNDKMVSTSSSYEFTNIINRSLVAHFVPRPPPLAFTQPQPGTLAFTWPTNASGVVLQQNTDLGTTNWFPVTNATTIQGTNRRVNIVPQPGNRFFRLMRP